jgi:hypothetical protein
MRRNSEVTSDEITRAVVDRLEEILAAASAGGSLEAGDDPNGLTAAFIKKPRFSHALIILRFLISES